MESPNQSVEKQPLTIEELLVECGAKPSREVIPRPISRLGGLHQKPPAQRELIKEEPWHRVALHLIALAKTPKEVANIVQRTPSTVYNLIRQTWFQDQLEQLLAGRSQSRYDQMLSGQDVESLTRLVEIRDDPKTPKGVALSAAFGILDRHPNVGKPVQRAEVRSGSLETANDVKSLEEELEKLRKEKRELLGSVSESTNPEGN